jgi:hypothetical protein
MEIKVIDRSKAPPKPAFRGSKQTYPLDEAVLSAEVGQVLEITPAEDQPIGQLQMRAANTLKRLAKSNAPISIDYWPGESAVYVEVLASGPPPQDRNSQN